MTAPAPTSRPSTEAVDRLDLDRVPPPSLADLRVTVRSCIGETIPLRRRWVSAIMERVVAPLLDRITAAEAQRDEARFQSRQASEAAFAAEARAEEAREEAADAISQLDAWFNVKARADTDLRPAFKDAIGGFLRTSRCGGMPAKLSDQIEAVLNRFIDLNAGLIVAPIIEALVAERNNAATADRDRLADEVERLKDQNAALLRVITAARIESVFAAADEADGTATKRTRKTRFHMLRDALNGVGDISARKALGFPGTIEGEVSRRALTATGGTTDGQA